jgi:hypothetical protein
MAFYYHMIYSPETNNQGKTSDYIYIYYIQRSKGCCFTTLHTLCICVLDVASDPSCCSPGSHMDISPLPLLQINCLSCSLTRRTVPPLRPPPHSDPISIRVHALPHLSVCYINLLTTRTESCSDQAEKFITASFFYNLGLIYFLP